ncbi:MAG TPA: hypothetical protein VGK32_15945 [Vicinamibacterales bacterium]
MDRRRRGGDNPAHALAHQQFADDEAGFGRLAEADVICDEEVDTREGAWNSVGSMEVTEFQRSVR